jgi:lipopolysaccharide export LptBFGC system permease protein LptF
MTKLQRYILIETTRALVPAFAALVLIMVVGLCMQMLHEGLDVVRLRGLLVPMLAYCVPMVLPSAFLTAVIMNFGRLSADNELIAVRAAGIPLLRLVYPVLLAGVALSVLALYFQFELNPRAHAAISALRYDALKQVLLDKVALSAKRELAFRGDKSIHIQYDDFVNGRMTNLVVIQADLWSHRPINIITAASATVHADSSPAGNIQFVMQDCVITPFGLTRNGEASPPFAAEEATLSPPLGDPSANLLDDDKYLPTIALMHKLWDLKAQLAREERDLKERSLMPPPEARRDPDAVKRQQRAAIRSIELEVQQIDKQLNPLQDDLKKYGEREPSRLRQAIAQSTDRLEQVRTELKGLKDQQASMLQEITRMRMQEGGLVDYPRLEDLQSRLKSVQSQIDTQEQESVRLEGDVAASQKELTASLDRAGRSQELASALEKRRAKVLSGRPGPMQVAQWADDRGELNSLLIRIHKRLVQAVSVFLFALIGIPLGIMAGGRSVMAAFGLSFAIVLVVFYPFVIFGQIAAEAGALPIAPAMWGGNAFVFIIGAALTAKVLRG